MKRSPRWVALGLYITCYDQIDDVENLYEKLSGDDWKETADRLIAVSDVE